jgi:tRNA A-37 threonylcarbamoyl transferase component Bud32
MNKQLLLMLVRDVSEGILELLNLGIYHTDLQLRNVILIVNNTETINFKLLFDREEVLAKMSCLQFKIIDF